MPLINLNMLSAEIHNDNEKWWRDLETGEPLIRNKGELLMLVISELAEAMEGERKDQWDDHLPHRKMVEVELADVKIRIHDFAGGFGYPLKPAPMQFFTSNKGEMLLRICKLVIDAYYNTVRDEKASIIGADLSAILGAVDAYAETFGYDVDGAVSEKRTYNKSRKDHTAEARLAAGGKKW